MAQLDTPNGEYVIGALVGRGGMGQVHLARHASGRRVVVKRLRDTLVPDQRLATRFGDEGRVSRRVCHPNVVRVFEHGVSADGTPFIVMEHARGMTLRTLVLEQGPLSLARIRHLVRQLLDGLAAIHEAGIVHADIKSNNLIVDTEGGADHLTIIDFGLARTRTSQAADDGVIAGTPEYIAPEVLRGEAPTVRADVYSAAIVAYELLVGITPFGGDSPLAVLHRQMSEDVELPADVRALISPELERVLLRALEKDPPRRFPDARSFGAAFDQAIAASAANGPAPRTRAPSSHAELAPEDTPDDAPEDAPDDAAESQIVLHLRQELVDALESGRPDPVIAAYLALADALVTDGHMLAAVQELEGALVLLLPHRGEPPRSVWRIEMLLAAMHDRLGNLIRARRAAMDAHAHAQRAGCRIAERHASTLMNRLLASR